MNNIEGFFGIVLGICVIIFCTVVGFVFPPMWAGIWIGLKCTAYSYKNLIGNKKVRIIFISICFKCQVVNLISMLLVIF